jgi:UDP-N-acetyl-D-glucosamine dehydrogenase
VFSQGEILLTDAASAEMAKLVENAYRDVNIAFANELSLITEALRLDVWEVIRLANQHPRVNVLSPGPGVGGHCIPVDPYYLSWRARQFDFVDRFVELAGDINLAMPRHVLDLVAEALNERGRSVRGATIGVLGVAFKPDVRDARNSPAADVIAGLAERGGDVRYHDPHVPSFRDAAGVTRSSMELDTLLADSDVVVVVTGHRAIDWDRVYADAGLVVDTVNNSRGRSVRDRQVLRLGAGWATPATAA